MTLIAGGASIIKSGIEHACIWNMNTAFEGSAAPIASNWSATWATDVNDPNSIGSSSVTQSSGIFTFGATGVWEVSFTMQTSDNASVDLDCFAEIHRTEDNSSYAATARSGVGLAATNLYLTTTARILIDVTDTSNDKVRFHASGLNSADCYGHDDYIHTYAVFKRLGAT
tara:strand:- start:134 stop:643 length:510 start_codon:yes stop_codon:yes gene_type:complete